MSTLTDKQFLMRVKAVRKHRNDMSPLMVLEFLEEFERWCNEVADETVVRITKEYEDVPSN